MASFLQPSWDAQAAEITAVMGVKNKCWRHVRRCLESLCRQTTPLKVIVVDYGSDQRHLRQIRRLTRPDWIELIEVTRDTEPWREGRALNIGIKRVETDYLFTTNADLIFIPDFVSLVLDALKQDGDAFVVCLRRTELDESGEAIGLSDACYYGTCMGAPTDWWLKVQGYDERYELWGYVDMDLAFRAIADGKCWHDISSDERVYHQYHRHSSDKARVAATGNREIFYETRGIIRNGEQWGEL